MSLPVVTLIKLCKKQKETGCIFCPFWLEAEESTDVNCYLHYYPYDWDISELEKRFYRLQIKWKNQWPKSNTNSRKSVGERFHKPRFGKCN